MSSSGVKKDKEQHIKSYKKMMSNIEFMQQYMQDSEIFNPESQKFKSFLTQAFARLNLNFHYLSYLKDENIDAELVKASRLLLILPMKSIKGNGKLFDGMSDEDIHKFWIRLFGLFTINKSKELNAEPILSSTLENEFDIFESISSISSYLNYSLRVSNLKKINATDINSEIKSWSDEVDMIDDNDICSENMSIKGIEKVDILSIEKLIIHLKQILTMYGDLKDCRKQGYSEFYEFFVEFSKLSKDILKLKHNICVVDSYLLDDLYHKIVNKNEYDISDNLNFIKTCNNLIQTLKLKIKMVDSAKSSY